MAGQLAFKAFAGSIIDLISYNELSWHHALRAVGGRVTSGLNRGVKRNEAAKTFVARRQRQIT